MFKAHWFHDPLNPERMVRLYLRPGKPKRFHWKGETDEGWSSIDVEFRRVGKWIYRTWASDGRDCDGRLQEYSITRWCPALGFNSFPNLDGSPGRARYMNWERCEEYQRDESAERMGY